MFGVNRGLGVENAPWSGPDTQQARASEPRPAAGAHRFQRPIDRDSSPGRGGSTGAKGDTLAAAIAWMGGQRGVELTPVVAYAAISRRPQQDFFRRPVADVLGVMTPLSLFLSVVG